MTWNTTKLTEYVLEIQLDFKEPDLISNNQIYDELQISFNNSFKILRNLLSNKQLNQTSWTLKKEIPPQAKKTYPV